MVVVMMCGCYVIYSKEKKRQGWFIRRCVNNEHISNQKNLPKKHNKHKKKHNHKSHKESMRRNISIYQL